MCRYTLEGKITRSKIDLSTPFVAISHVWGLTEWQNVPGLGVGELLISKQKAGFLTGKLQALVGDAYFWMDILCVDQLDVQARIAIVKHIPAIYRSAQKTIVIRDGDGFHRCCIEAVNDFKSWRLDGKDKLAAHLHEDYKAHPNGCLESWLDRLWPLQEVLLSDRLQFTCCEDWEPPRREEFFSYRDITDFSHLNDALNMLSLSWAEYCADRKLDWEELPNPDAFIRAIFTSGSVERPRTIQKLKDIGLGMNTMFPLHYGSTRVTSKPRDFILAMLPPFEWYTPPKNAAQLTFGQLFVDSCEQAARAGYPFYPKITKGMTEVTGYLADSVLPSENIPTPQSLGDFIKLFGGSQSVLKPKTCRVGLLVDSFVAKDAFTIPEMDIALRMIERSMRFNKYLWSSAYKGELSIHGSWPDQWDIAPMYKHNICRNLTPPQLAVARLEPDYYEAQTIQILNSMWMGLGLDIQSPDATNDWNYFRKWLVKENPTHYKETLLLLAGIVSCGLGISMLRWARELFTPYIVFLDPDCQQSLLALANTRGLKAFDSWQGEQKRKIYCVQRLSNGPAVSGMDNVLMPMEEVRGLSGIDTRLGFVMGLVADFCDMTLSIEKLHERYKALHYNVKTVEDGKLGVVDPFWI